MLKLALVNRFGIATPSLLIHCNFFLQFVLLYVVNMQLTEYASVFLCSLHAEMTGTQILQGRCNLTSEIVGNRLQVWAMSAWWQPTAIVVRTTFWLES